VLGGADAGLTARVNDLAFSASGTSLYSCADDCTVTCWNVATGAVQWTLRSGKQPCRRLALHPAGGDALAGGGAAIKLWDLSTRTVRRKFAGHAAPVACMRFSPAGRFLLSAAADRFLSLWDCGEDGPAAAAAAGDAAAARAPVMVFTLDSAPRHLAFSPLATGGGAAADAALLFLAVAESGAVGVWHVDAPAARRPRKRAPAGAAAAEADAPAAAPLPPQRSLGSTRKARRVVAAGFPAGGVAALCAGSPALPTFDRVPLLGDDGALADAPAGDAAAAASAGEGEGGLLLEGGKKKKAGKAAAAADVVGPADTPLPAGRTAAAGGGGKAKKAEKAAAGGEGSDGDEDAGSLDGDETLEDKVGRRGEGGGEGGRRVRLERKGGVPMGA
jgi:hypothetical protein